MAKKILIIDDDNDIRDAVSLVLQKSGYETVTASTGAEGIRQAAAVKPDLVLCDMMMETVDAGMGVAQAIKKDQPSTPVMLMSSIAESSTMNFDIHAEGFTGTVQKPIDPQSLIRTVGLYLGK